MACKDCLDDNLAIHVQPANLAERRSVVYRAANRGESDHLVALRAEHHTGHVLFPANVVDPAQSCVTEGSRDEQALTGTRGYSTTRLFSSLPYPTRKILLLDRVVE